MSLYDWNQALQMSASDPPFYALIMAAMLKADTHNQALLRNAWPDTWREVEKRYNSRLALGNMRGALPEDAPGSPPQPEEG